MKSHDPVHWVIAELTCGLLLLASFAGIRRLRFDRDFFFLVFLVQMVLYILIGPSLVLSFGEGLQLKDYLNHQIMAIVWFLLPVCLGYRVLSSCIDSTFETEKKFHISPNKLTLFFIVTLLTQALYLFLLVKNQMVSRRIGFENLLVLQSSIPRLELLFIRSNDLILLPFISFLLFLYYFMPQIPGGTLIGRRMVLVLLFICSGIYFALALLNSRTQLISGVVFLFGTHLLSGARTKRLSNIPKVFGNIFLTSLIAVVGVYLILIVSNFRARLSHGDPLISVLDPTYSFQKTEHDVLKNEWLTRIDCMDLIARIDLERSSLGLALGESWYNPFIVSFTQFFGSAESIQLKRQGETTAKSTLLKKFTTSESKDYPTCTLTDLYGNFGVAAYLPGAVLLALLYSFGFWLFLNSKRDPRFFFLAAIFGLHIFPFEQEFISIFVGWVRYLPVLIPIWIFMPFNKLKYK